MSRSGECARSEQGAHDRAEPDIDDAAMKHRDVVGREQKDGGRVGVDRLDRRPPQRARLFGGGGARGPADEACRIPDCRSAGSSSP